MNIKDIGKKYTPLIVIVLIALIVLSITLAVLIGSVDITAKDVYKIVLSKIFNISLEEIPRAQADIVWELRLPRLIMAVLVGISLSLSGVVMQSIVKNPLADPYVLGISSGASLGATFAFLFNIGKNLGSYFMSIMAFLGAFITSLLVLTVANYKKRSNSARLILAGMAIASLCTALASFIIWMSSSPAEASQRINFWLMGSLEPSKWEHIKFLAPIVFIVLIFFQTQYRTLNLMLLGDDTAITLGKNLYWYRIVYLLLVSSLIGIVVSVCGVIGFVGLIFPHIIRSIFGTDHKIMLPITVLSSSIFMIWMDVLSRTLKKGSALPIGVVIALLGAPIFIYLLFSRTYGFGDK